MRIGPLTFTHMQILTTILDENGAKYHVTSTAEEAARERERRQTQPLRVFPTYEGTGDFLYLDIEAKDALLIRGEVEKMGLSLPERDVEPVPEVPEYLCLKCDHLAHAPGLCPTHGTELLEFSAWVAGKRENADFNWKRMIWAVVAIVLLTAIFLQLKR